MAYLGKFQNGDRLPLAVACVDKEGVPTAPDLAPTAKIFIDDGTLQATVSLPAVHADINSAGAFQGLFKIRYLEGGLATDKYYVAYRYYLSGVPYQTETDSFELVAGGNSAGTVIALAHTPQHGQSVVQYDTEDGNIYLGRNPV